MRNNSRKLRIIGIIIAIVVVVVAIVGIYTAKRLNVLDRAEYNRLARDITRAANEGTFIDQDSLKEYITSWGDEAKLDYTVDHNGNIIFNCPAAQNKKDVKPTVVFVSYNFETVSSDARSLAAAAMIAGSDIKSGRRIVIFCNDARGVGAGYKSVNRKYVPAKSKVIYLDYGDSSYISRSSFGEEMHTITIPAPRKKNRCDTAVTVHIAGISSGIVDPDIEEQPSPISEMALLLQRLKSRSTTCQLAELEIGTNGNMYPVSADMTILMNSYSVDNFTKYLDKRIKTWYKTYTQDHPDITYTYEVSDDSGDLPSRACSLASTRTITNVLYTIKNGAYIYGAADELPEGAKKNDVYGINCITGIREGKNNIYIDIISQGSSADVLDSISGDDRAAAELFGCTYTKNKTIDVFRNKKKSLADDLIRTYSRVNYISNVNYILDETSDTCFTPCAYLAERFPKLDIVHLRMNKGKAAVLTNTILYYLETKGNFLSL